MKIRASSNSCVVWFAQLSSSGQVFFNLLHSINILWHHEYFFKSLFFWTWSDSCQYFLQARSVSWVWAWVAEYQVASSVKEYKKYILSASSCALWVLYKIQSEFRQKFIIGKRMMQIAFARSLNLIFPHAHNHLFNVKSPPIWRGSSSSSWDFGKDRPLATSPA